MTRYELVKVANYLKEYKKISSIYRVSDTILKITFDKGKGLFFDIKKGDSYIFLKDDYKVTKKYTAPFDIVIHKRFTNSQIQEIKVLEGNRILQIKVSRNSKYKLDISILQFEFTGRNTNIIILDESKIVQEAIRHIDSSTSFREVRVGEPLQELEPRSFKPKDQEPIDDVEEFLKDEYLKREFAKLRSLQTQKVLFVQKKIDKLKQLLNLIDDKDKLEAKMDLYYHQANLITANIYKLKNYQRVFEVEDFDGNQVIITLPKDAKTPSLAANMLFKMAKKLKQKAKNSYIEKENLTSKIEFYQNLQQAVKIAKSSDELGLYFPKQPKKIKKIKVDANIENFYFTDYKLSIGKNQKGNQSLLENAKMSDVWMHIKDISSSHVIIRSDKKNVPLEVLEFGAKLCVDFSGLNSGGYLVDYTNRRNVKIREGANVNYVEYKTIKVTKE